MTSQAERKRRTKAQTAARAQEAKAPATAGPTREARVAAKPSYPPRKSGLEWLIDKQKISSAQKRAGEWYGARFRVSIMEGTQSLRSCLGDSVRGSGEGGLPPGDLGTAEWRAQSVVAQSGL